MKKNIFLLCSVLFVVGTSFGAGYKIPEQSTRSMGTAAAYVAGANDADAAYYNPANMSWMDEGFFTEVGAKYIYLPKITFKGFAPDPLTKTLVVADGKTKKESFIVPYIHYVSPKIGRARFGISLTTPAGLSKRWNLKPQSYFAEEFTLKVVELNPVISYRINNQFSVGAGFRVVYATGVVKYARENLYKVDMDGDTVEYGYNLAFSLKPDNQSKIALTYRSKIDLNVKGNAKGEIPVSTPPTPFESKGDVTIPLPASLNIAYAYTIKNRTTIELVYERTFWSEYKKLDFNFENAAAEAVLGKPKTKDWDDSDTIRLGLTHQINNQFTLLLGFAYDQTPIPTPRVSFELPDSDGFIYSIGGIYKLSRNLEIGVAYLYMKKRDRNIYNNYNGIVGEFSDSKAHLFNISAGYKF